MPLQVIDYTYGRDSTFFDGEDGFVRHTDFTHPYCSRLRGHLLEACRHCDLPVIDGGVYAVTQGPRLETAAEIERLARDGADMVGMPANWISLTRRSQSLPIGLRGAEPAKRASCLQKSVKYSNRRCCKCAAC